MSEEKLRGLVESGPRSVLAILAALNSRGATGSLRFEPALDPENMVEFLFRDGKLLFASTNRPGDRLGEFLVRRNLLSSRQATTALLDARRHGELFHAYLVVRGLLDAGIMSDLLYERAEELLYDILQTTDGRFVFEPVSLKLLQRLGPTVDEELVARLLTFRNLWPHAYETLWTAQLVLRQGPGVKAARRSEALSEVERLALDLVDGQRTVQRLLEGRRDRVELSICLVQFLEDGLLEVIARNSRPRVATVPVDPATAERRREEASAVRATAPEQRDVGGVLSIDLEAIPVMTSGTQMANISTVGLTMDDLFALSQIDGNTSLHQLTSITGLAEKQLFRLLHHLVGLGYVELRDRPVPGPPARSMRPPSRVTATRPEPPAPAPAGSHAQSFQSSRPFEVPRPPRVSAEANSPPSRPPEVPHPPRVSAGANSPTSRPPEVPHPPRVSAGASSTPAGSAEAHPRKPAMPEAPPAAKPPPAAVASAEPKKPVEPVASAGPKKPVEPVASVAPKAKPAASAPEAPRSSAFQLHEHALAAYNTQKFTIAEDLLRKALKVDAESSAIRAHLALAMAERPEQLAAAKQLVQEAYEEDPLESRCYEVMGFLKLRMGEYDKAKPLLERALLLDKRKSRSSARVLEELKSDPPGKGQKPDEVWAKLRKHIRLSC